MATILRSGLKSWFQTPLKLISTTSGFPAIAILHRDGWSDNTSGLFGSFLGFACGLGLASAWASQRESMAECGMDGERAEHARWEDFKAWMREAGADMNGVELCRSEKGGLGLKSVLDVGFRPKRESLLPAWMAFWKSGNRVASFPMDLAITPMVACNDPLVGPHIQKLCDREDVDAEMSLILFLMLQSLLGSESRWSSWMALLPKEFHLPLQYTDAELEELKGTTLLSAVIVQRNSLRLRWRALEELCHDACAQIGISNKPCFEDFVWACLIYWTRGMSLPNSGEDIHCIIPGLDFCNHAQDPNARWRYPRELNKSEIKRRTECGYVSKDHNLGSKMVDLVADKMPAENDPELYICYGDKSNEELLFSYGFTLDTNRMEHLMINFPVLELADDQKILENRLKLLAVSGLKPQFSLPGGLQLQTAKEAAIKFGKDINKMASSNGGLQHMFPLEVWRVLEAFVLEPQELEEELKKLLSLEEKQQIVLSVLGNVSDIGLHMAKVTTLILLLSRKLNELEGSDGTGSLESDIRTMEAISKGGESTCQWSSLVYRAEQKCLTREWLYISEMHMQEVIEQMKEAKQEGINCTQSSKGSD